MESIKWAGKNACRFARRHRRTLCLAGALGVVAMGWGAYGFIQEAEAEKAARDQDEKRRHR